MRSLQSFCKILLIGAPVLFFMPLGLRHTGVLPAPSAAFAAPLPEGNTGIAARYPRDANIRSDANVLFVDDFESYSTASQLMSKWSNYYQAGNTRITTNAADVFAGGKSLQFTQPQTGGEVANEIVKTISPTQDKLFVRVYTKFSSGFSTGQGHNGIRIQARYRGPGNVPNGRDFFMFSLENSAYYNEPQPGYTHVYAYHPGQRSQWGDHWYPTGKVLPYDYNPGNFGPSFVSRPNLIPQTNRWYCYEMMVKANTPGVRDGRVGVWIDGKLIADFQNLRLRDVSTLKIDQVMLGLHASRNTAGADRKWYDNLVVAKSYIGPRR